MQKHFTPTMEDHTMTESQQSKRGWFSSLREHRRAKRQQFIERDLRRHERETDGRGMYGSSSPYQHSGPITYGSAGGFGDGGGGCGDGGGGC